MKTCNILSSLVKLFDDTDFNRLNITWPAAGPIVCWKPFFLVDFYTDLWCLLLVFRWWFWNKNHDLIIYNTCYVNYIPRLLDDRCIIVGIARHFMCGWRIRPNLYMKFHYQNRRILDFAFAVGDKCRTIQLVNPKLEIKFSKLANPFNWWRLYNTWEVYIY